MGSGSCFGGSNENQMKTINEGCVDLGGESKKDYNETEDKGEGILVKPSEAKSMQGAMRGYLARKEVKQPLFDIRDAKT